jgi:hypothetical protein
MLPLLSSTFWIVSDEPLRWESRWSVRNDGRISLFALSPLRIRKHYANPDFTKDALQTSDVTSRHVAPGRGAFLARICSPTSLIQCPISAIYRPNIDSSGHRNVCHNSTLNTQNGRPAEA